MKRPRSLNEPLSDDQTGDGSRPRYPKVALAWHQARPPTWNAQQAYQFLQACQHLHQLACSIPIGIREHRQRLATTFQLPPIAVRNSWTTIYLALQLPWPFLLTIVLVAQKLIHFMMYPDTSDYVDLLLLQLCNIFPQSRNSSCCGQKALQV